MLKLISLDPSSEFILCCVYLFSLATCQSCCNEAVLEFPDVSFDLATCLDPGCLRAFGQGQTCTDLFPGAIITDSNRRGCEIGRDFLTAGISSLLNNGDLIQCRSDGRLQVIELTLPLAQDIVIGSAQCRECCDAANSVDNGLDEDLNPIDTEPDDFLDIACEAACDNVDTCFNQDDHRARTGCLIGLDFLSQQQALHFDKNFFCLANGNVRVEPLTAFPTQSPTKVPTRSPSKKPTTKPTDSPIGEPTISPTANPTIIGFPTSLPTSNPLTNQDSDSEAGGLTSGPVLPILLGFVGILLISAIIVHYKKSRALKKVTEKKIALAFMNKNAYLQPKKKLTELTHKATFATF